ncbi:MAG: hypothetical protein EBZ59_00890, partial [Planctomycetia bacterium]|nr:hypothetical protein [Planctomycetia bacterium]
MLVDYANLLLDRMAAPGLARRFAGDLPAVENAVTRNPDDNVLRVRLAQAFMAIRRFVDARVHLMAARQAIGEGKVTVAGEPVDRDVIDLLIATAWAGSGPPERAAEFIAETIGFRLGDGRFADSSPAASGPSPRNQAALFLMLEGLLRDRLREPDAADIVLERCVQRHPDDLAARMRYGERMAARKEVDKAVAAFTKARQLAPEDDPRGVLADVQIRILEDKRSEAIALLGEARRRFPRRNEVLEAAMRCADRWRDGDLALSVLDECVEWYGARPILLTMLSGIRIAPQNVDAAQARLEALRSQAGQGNVAISMLEARLLMAREQWFAAKRLLESLRPEVMANAEAKRRVDLHLATCSWNLGDHDEQLAAYRRMGPLYSDRAAWIAARLEAAAALAASGQQADAILEVRAIDGAMKGLPPDQLREMLRRSEEPLRLRIDLVAVMPERQRYWSPVDTLIKAMEADPECGPARVASAKSRMLTGQGKL